MINQGGDEVKKHKITIISILIIIFLCICYTVKTYDINTDGFYLIRLGKYILNHGIDLKDHFSFISGLSYTYPHWLYSVYVYLFYSKLGFFGVYLSNIISFIVLVLSIYVVNVKINKNKLVALLISIFSVFILSKYIVARGQVLSIVLLFWEVYFIIKLIETGKKKYVVLLPILSLLIANIHGTIWPMFFILFLPFIGEHLLYIIFNKKKKKELKKGNITIEKVDNIKLVLIAFGISLLMGLLTPSRICYTYVFKIMLGDSQKYIGEHSTLQPIKEPLFLFLVTLLMLYKEKIKARDFFMIFGLIILSLISVKYLLILYTIGILYISKLFIEQLNKSGDKTFLILENILFNKKIATSLLIIFIGLIGLFGIKKNYNEKYINGKKYPVSAVKYIKKNLDYKNIRMYNDYDIGGYILFNDIPVFIDPRCDLYFKEFNNKNLDIFDDSIMLYKKLDSYKSIFKKYNIDHVLLKKNDKLFYVISADSNYEIIYKDKYFVLFKDISSQ